LQLIVVAGLDAKKVWVFTVEEEVANSHGVMADFLSRITLPPKSRSIRIKLTKFIASNDGISRLCLNSGIVIHLFRVIIVPGNLQKKEKIADTYHIGTASETEQKTEKLRPLPTAYMI
jgi:hypothetical protein